MNNILFQLVSIVGSLKKKHREHETLLTGHFLSTKLMWNKENSENLLDNGFSWQFCYCCYPALDMATIYNNTAFSPTTR